MSSSNPSHLGTQKMIERQMFLWQSRLKAAREKPAAGPAPGIRFITICRSEGTLGDETARELARRLGWHVFDKEIVNYIAENSHVRESLVRQLDERSQGLLTDTIMRLLRMPEWKSFGCDEYHEALLDTLAYLSTQGNAVLVGRGSNFALRKEEHGLHVRTVASVDVRAQRLSQEWHVSPELARRCMLAGDQERKNFVRHHFKQDLDDIRYYDLIFNTDHMTVDSVVGSILGAMGLRGETGNTQMPGPRLLAKVSAG